MKVDFDKYADSYDQLLKQSTGFFSKDDAYFSEYKVRLAKEIVGSQPAHILEFGCGVGRNIPFLRSYFPQAEVCGSDISPKSLEVAQSANAGVRFFLEGDAEIQGKIFDLIFIAGVFHHIAPEYRNQAVKTIFSRLAPGGGVVIFEHNPFNPITRRIVSNCQYDKDAELIKPKQMRHILSKEGICTKKQLFTLFFPPAFRRLAQLERHLGWLPLGGQYCIYALRR